MHKGTRTDQGPQPRRGRGLSQWKRTGNRDHAADCRDLRMRFQKAIASLPPVPAEAVAAAVFTRFCSRREQTLADKLRPARRDESGGHPGPK